MAIILFGTHGLFVLVLPAICRPYSHGKDGGSGCYLPLGQWGSRQYWQLPAGLLSLGCLSGDRQSCGPSFCAWEKEL